MGEEEREKGRVEYFPKVGGLVFHLVPPVSYRWVSLGAS